MGKPRVLVVGTGFAGYHCLRTLERVLPADAAERTLDTSVQMLRTVPFLAMGAAIALGGLMRVALVTLIVAVVSGFGTWLIAASNSVHLGASGIVALDLQQKLHRIGRVAFAWPDAHMALTSAALDGLKICAPILGIICLAAVLAPLALGGWSFSTEALLPATRRVMRRAR